MPEHLNQTISEEGNLIAFQAEESFGVNLEIPADTFETLKLVAAKKQLSVETVIKFLISEGLRDLEPELVKSNAVNRLRNRKRYHKTVENDLVS